jgi:hypothetical protein
VGGKPAGAGQNLTVAMLALLVRDYFNKKAMYDAEVAGNKVSGITFREFMEAYDKLLATMRDILG